MTAQFLSTVQEAFLFCSFHAHLQHIRDDDDLPQDYDITAENGKSWKNLVTSSFGKLRK